MPVSSFRLLILLVGLNLSLGAAQTAPGALRLGAILPLSGAEQEAGRVIREALGAAQEAVEDKGLELELLVADNRSDSAESLEEARTLMAQGVHALICCETPAVAAALAPLAEAEGVLLLSLSAPEPSGTPSYWTFSLEAGAEAQLERLRLETALQPFGLMLPAGPGGDGAARTLRAARAGMARYSRQGPLTPAALWVATREPASVVVWDGAEGTLAAAEALLARGYSGTLVVQAAIWDELSALEGAKLTGARSPLSPVVLGYTLSDAHPSKATVARLHRALIGVPDSWLSDRALTRGAAAWDAVQLLGTAAEQVLAYGLELTNPRAVRQGLRDALVGLGEVVGAGGSYDFQEGRAAGLEPASLVIGTWQRGRFRP